MKDPLKQHIYKVLGDIPEMTGLNEDWYIAKDKNGEWWTHSEEPEITRSNFWCNPDALCFQIKIEFMPTFDDWTETCVRVGDIFDV